ncbi:High-affinity Na(+)/H(+) antiporter NhaS3 [Streptococcus parauberis]|uniref:cation:proton antiporter n=1 Tax=Streptococcus parauberis TaxID=1348 RepID=UPI000CCFC7F3|nr:cation:proton antiporter [Streptococcus parauberis]PNY21310.1 High-affinity Na(+)/H(+) antiporter NhaS3 [Streptococcus parauberis]
MQELLHITIILFASLLATQFSGRIGIPAVVGQLLVGILIGPAVLNLVHQGELIHFLSELGVILLMFLAGMEANLELLKRYLKPSLVVAICGVIIPVAAFYLVTLAMGYQAHTAIFYGIVFAATSVSITVEVLQEYNKVKTNTGAVILGAAVADDIIAVLLLSFFISSSKSDSGSSNQLIFEVLGQLAFLLFLIALVKYIVPAIFKFVNKFDNFEKNTFLALLLCFTTALLANSVGMSAVIGSFFAGLAIGQTKYATEIEHETSIFAYIFFIPIFFASIALPLKLDGIISNLPIIVLFTVLAVATKLIPCYMVGRSFKFSKIDALIIGGGMVSRGEMALIIVQIGLADKLISSHTYSELVIVVILSTIIAPFILKQSFKTKKA